MSRYRHGLFAVVVSALFAALIAACYGSSDAGGADCTADLASITTTIFRPTCAKGGCHDSTSKSAGLNFDDPNVEGELVDSISGTCDGWTRVVRGSPDKSLLYQKVAGTAPCGGHMPLGGDLSSGQKSCIKAWITALPPAMDGGAGGADGGADGATACTNTQSDPANCGTCGHACPAGASCTAGACGCTSPLVACGATCTDTQTSATNCGACGTKCATGASCSAGKCVCPTGTMVCNGACVDESSDALNCGSCGHTCASGQVCLNGGCATGCGSLTQCGTSCVDTKTSSTHCGSCTVACPSGASCVNGACACPTGDSLCNGACISTTSDPSNCGGCGVVCSGGMTCSSGHCVCPSGDLLCGGTCVASDTSNCGACGVVCAPGQTCTNNKCTCGNASVSFSGAVQPIFTASCALSGCHLGATAKEGMNLASGSAYSNIVNVLAKECSDGRLRVKPGDPANSYVIQKLTNVNLCFGGQMPKTGGALPTSEETTIANWICEGAPNN